jgi:hypothetical protein
MSDNKPTIHRRDLLKTTGVATAAGLLSTPHAGAQDKDDNAVTDIRPPLTIDPNTLSQELLNAIRTTPRVNHDPFPAYAKTYLPFAMAQSNEVTRSGRVWTAWIGGEDGPIAYMLASYSDDGGESWRDPVFVIDPAAYGLPMGTRTGCLWCDPKGRLWLFFKQSCSHFDGSCSNWYIRCDDPDAETPIWSEPTYASFGATITKPIVRKNGEWLLPVSLWERWHIGKLFQYCYHELDSVRGANVFVSDDEGVHWRYCGGHIFEDSCFNEHSVVELTDGRLWMLSRCHKEIAQSFSENAGRAWGPQSTAFPHANAKICARRLQSGRILLIKHGKDFENRTGRWDLTAFLSEDDGKTWKGGLLLDERRDGTGVSYPDIAQAPDGTVYVHYDHGRTTHAEILFAKFRDDDVLAGKLVSKDAALKNIVKDKKGMHRSTA